MPKKKENSLICDCCGKIITDYVDDLFHFSQKRQDGTIDGHRHACLRCFEELDIPFVKEPYKLITQN